MLRIASFLVSSIHEMFAKKKHRRLSWNQSGVVTKPLRQNSPESAPIRLLRLERDAWSMVT